MPLTGEHSAADSGSGAAQLIDRHQWRGQGRNADGGEAEPTGCGRSDRPTAGQAYPDGMFMLFGLFAKLLALPFRLIGKLAQVGRHT